MKAACINWLDSLTWQADFYERSLARRRVDLEFEWRWFENTNKTPLKLAIHQLKKILGLKRTRSFSIDWVRMHADKIWQTRCMLSDELSRLLFDSSIILRITDHHHYYAQRIDFEDLVKISNEVSFEEPGLPRDYLGLPLKVYKVRICSRLDIPELKIISTDSQLRLLNSYRQYLINRDSIDFTPRIGGVILDCGACIGEMSLLFAGLVGITGEVHLFDPIPLHIRYCNLQATMNPQLMSALRINALAVADKTFTTNHAATDNRTINPGECEISRFSCTTLDDYAKKNLTRVDFIKMDIEGSEIAALTGAKDLIQRFSPDLAISGYHKPEDLWMIPEKIRSLNPRYRLAFGHYSPVSWESVFYATAR